MQNVWSSTCLGCNGMVCGGPPGMFSLCLSAVPRKPEGLSTGTHKEERTSVGPNEAIRVEVVEQHPLRHQGET